MTIKKIIGLVFLLGSSAVFSGTMAAELECSEVSANTACEMLHWNFTARALYLQAVYTHDPWENRLAALDTLTGYTQDPAILRGYGWGFFAEASYYFAKGKGITANIYSLDYLQVRGDYLNHGASREIRQSTDWLAVNLELGQILPIRDDGGVRVYAGIQYAYLDKHRGFSHDLSLDSFNELLSLQGYSNARFVGVGPRWGAELSHYLPDYFLHGFKVYANGAANVILGPTKSSFLEIANPEISRLGGLSRTSKQFAVVPEFDARLGVNYVQAVYQGQLSLDIGWMVFDYLSLIENKTDVVSSDVLLQGFYAGLKWSGNFA
ncbi:MAG: hypothetical protein K0U24_08110 [Gammaproteobacteria bacterium]|nr:hypothetical protein [Gammaproteobacteria bacterium]MCH9764165.1 hypothetical protein [Gammaproteobacteria bacterium]